MQLRLISHQQCPFVQRAVITLLEKDVAHTVDYVDLQNKPAWFTALSPRGKVPLLIADGATLFESAAICEFLEETHPSPPLMPNDPVARARDRGWFAFASEDLFVPLYKLTVSTSATDLEAVRGALAKALNRLETELAGRLWLSGDGCRFGMADVFLAPFFVRAGVLADAAVSPLPAELNAVRAYAERVTARPAVQASIPAGFAQQMVGRMQAAGAAVLPRPA